MLSQLLKELGKKQLCLINGKMSKLCIFHLKFEKKMEIHFRHKKLVIKVGERLQIKTSLCCLPLYINVLFGSPVHFNFATQGSRAKPPSF